MTPSSFVPSPAHLTPANPTAPMVPPTRPPSRAWDDEDGRPSSQVNRFQMIPPMRPPKTMSSSKIAPLSPLNVSRGRPALSWRLTTELLTVRATSTESSAPTRLRIAARVTAPLGESAPVAIEAAMAFPVSWNPLVKSKARATTTTRAKIIVAVVMSGNDGSRRALDKALSPC